MNSTSQFNKVDIANFSKKEIGKTIKSSKVEYIYEFFINGVPQTVKLVRSFFSDKIRIFVNGKCVHKEDNFVGNNFIFKYNTEEYKLVFEQPGPKVYKLDVFQSKGNAHTDNRISTMRSNDMNFRGNNGFTNMTKKQQHIVIDGSSQMSDSQSIGLGSPIQRILGGTPKNGDDPYMNGYSDGTPKNDSPYYKMHSYDHNVAYEGQNDTPNKNAQGQMFTWGNQSPSRRAGRANTLNYDKGMHSPLTPQDKVRHTTSEQNEKIPEFRTPQMPDRRNTFTPGCMPQDSGYPGQYVAAPKRPTLCRKDSGDILEEDAIFFFKTNL